MKNHSDENEDIVHAKPKSRLDIWDMFTVLILIVTACMVLFFILAYLYPDSGFNPYLPGLANASATYTITPIELDATWTMTPVIPTSTPTEAFVTDPTLAALETPAQLCDDYSFEISTVDVTIPNETLLVTEQSFVKTWKIKNTGSCTWGDGYGLVYSYGERMSGEPVALSAIVLPGQEAEISVNLKAPGEIGEYTSVWQMANTEGIAFGKGLLVTIIVKAGATSTPIPEIAQTPNQTQTLQAAFFDIDSQLENSLKGNIAFNKPEQMKKDETTSIELILSPSLSENALATQLVDLGGFVTSTADPNLLLSSNGTSVSIETSQIEITQRMKATLKSQDPGAFIVEEMHDNAEQIVSSMAKTTWRWSVTAKDEGSHRLELVIYRLVKYEGREFWREVEAYNADIVVEVTPLDKVKSLDWKWIGSVIIIPLIVTAWNWWRNRKKKSEVMQIKILDDTKDTRIKRKKKK